MWTTVCICAVTIAAMIAGILFFPEIRITNRCTLSSYWVISTVGAAVLLCSGRIGADEVLTALSADTAVNPLKILVLFISMTILSIFLDEMGFFGYLADKTLHHAGGSQKRLFVHLYLIVSILTVFTSNDIIILSFTPFICYFAKNAGIDPIPYLTAEFVAANTWSMALIIGNPTNIYIGTAYGIDFIGYFKVMALPTLLAGAVSFAALYIMFRKKLSEPICCGNAGGCGITDNMGLWIGLSHLIACTLILAAASYAGIEMWKVAGIAVASLFVIVYLVSAVTKRDMRLNACLRRAPWQLAPFLLSMFILTMALTSNGVTGVISDALGTENTVWSYGAASFVGANVINNIPMSVLFCSIMESVPADGINRAVYATVAGSNIGAFLTPIGALAGIMWTSILNHHGLGFSYRNFLKTGIFVAVPALLAALAGISLVL